MLMLDKNMVFKGMKLHFFDKITLSEIAITSQIHWIFPKFAIHDQLPLKQGLKQVREQCYFNCLFKLGKIKLFLYES